MFFYVFKDRDEYIRMDIIADYFTEKARLRARRKDQNESKPST